MFSNSKRSEFLVDCVSSDYQYVYHHYFFWVGKICFPETNGMYKLRSGITTIEVASYVICEFICVDDTPNLNPRKRFDFDYLKPIILVRSFTFKELLILLAIKT